MQNAAASDEEQTSRFDPDEYSAFIGQIELRAIWMSSAVVHNSHGAETPENVYLTVSDSAQYEPTDNGFICTHTYAVVAKTDGRDAFTVELTLNVEFDSGLPLTDQLFATFSSANLPLNTWPYLREFVASSVGRMGWQPLTLPALKRGVKPPPTPATSEPSFHEQRSSRKRRPKNSSSSGRADDD